MRQEHRRRPFVGVSLKMHLGHAQTKAWLRRIATMMVDDDQVDIAVLPSFPALEFAAATLIGTSIELGAQDCFWHDVGAFTGEVSPAVLKEIGCSYVEVGHAERRRIFGEDDDVIAHKAVAAQRHGLTPILCVGESHKADPSAALGACVSQLEPVLHALSSVAGGARDVIVAYEPVWAIGAKTPASAAHINAMAIGLRKHTEAHDRSIRIIYGGSAGPGLFAQIPDVDGLFLGRSALDPQRFAATVEEVAATAPVLRRVRLDPTRGR